MKLAVICFTAGGYDRMNELNKVHDAEPAIEMFCKCSALKDGCACAFVECSVEDWAKEQFGAKNAILFIGATGIAVRAIASSVKSKLSDSPVLVMDDKGQYVIPLLSGHVGGANELAMMLARETGAVPVITTSTDINGKLSIDVIAKKNGLTIINKDGIAAVSSKLIAGEPVIMIVDKELDADPDALKRFADTAAKDGMTVLREPADKKADVFIGRYGSEAPEASLYLEPKEYILGIGCRRDKDPDEMRRFVSGILQHNGISKDNIYKIASIDVKKDEKAIQALADELRVPFVTFSAEELEAQEGDFHESDFVRTRVGTGNVSERSAIAACEGCGEIVLPKQAENGMTLAIAKLKRRLLFIV